MKSPHIAIIVLHYKNTDDTRDCLASVFASTYSSYEVIVVNNDTAAHAEILHTAFPHAAYIQTKQNAGFAEGNNIGIRKALADARTDAVLLINNDAQLAPRALLRMAEPLAIQSVGMVAPRMMRMNEPELVDNLGLVLLSSGLAFNRLDETQKLFCPTGGCALYTRELLERIAYTHDNKTAYFDPSYFAYAEDFDLGFRARLSGFSPAYAKDAVVLHKGSAIHGKKSSFAIYHTYRNLVWTHWKNLPAIIFWINLPWLAIGWVFIFLLYAFQGDPIVIVRALFAAKLRIRSVYKHRLIIQKRRTVPAHEVWSWMTLGLFPVNMLKRKK